MTPPPCIAVPYGALRRQESAWALAGSQGRNLMLHGLRQDDPEAAAVFSGESRATFNSMAVEPWTPSFIEAIGERQGGRPLGLIPKPDGSPPEGCRGVGGIPGMAAVGWHGSDPACGADPHANSEGAGPGAGAVMEPTPAVRHN